MNASKASRQMTSVSRMLGLAALLASLMIVGCVTVTSGDHDEDGASDESQKHSYEVGENPVIDVTGFNGSIEIITGADGEVDIETTLRVPSKISYSATYDGNKVTIIAKRIGNGISIGRSPSAEIHLVVPEQAMILAKTSNGSISVDGVIGDGELKTSNGKIVITESEGTYVASTSNGRITMDDVVGQFRAETSNGGIDFSGTFTENSSNKLSTSNGSINIELDSDPSVSLDAKASNGKTISELPILATTTEQSHLVGKFGDGSAELEVRTSNGSVTIK